MLHVFVVLVGISNAAKSTRQFKKLIHFHTTDYLEEFTPTQVDPFRSLSIISGESEQLTLRASRQLTAAKQSGIV